jgi:hypothetical protein
MMLAFMSAMACAQSPASTPPEATTSASPPAAAETPATVPTTKVTRTPSPSEELNTLLMHATFLISGPGTGKDQISFGTVFVMGIPTKNNAKIAHFALVTAAHVLDGITGDNAFLQLRRKSDDGTYATFKYQLPIRKAGRPIYLKHPTADVAVMYADLPNDVPVTGLPPDMLMTDKTLQEIEVHPGDDAFVLGFPLAISAPGGFPILRVGHMASYPLTPMAVVKNWRFDLRLFGGNSGGPVYFTYVNRMFKGQIHLGVAQGILGLVIAKTFSDIPEFRDKELDYGVVVPAQFVRETLDMLPRPDDVQNSIK